MSADPLSAHPAYEKVRDLGAGSYGTVLLARERASGEEVAVKLILRGDRVSRHVEREVLNHLKLDHPHVVGLREVLCLEHHLALVLDYASGGDLRARLAARGALPEAEARRLFQQLLLALDYCHRMGVASRDVKPENILLDAKGEVKLADFGFSKDDEAQSLADTKLGSPDYVAPELMALAPGASYDARKADVWSCGVVLFEMVAGRPPWRRPSDERLKHMQRTLAMQARLAAGEYEAPAALSDAGRDFLARLLVTDPAARASVSQAVKHAWFQEGLIPGAAMVNTMLVQESKAAAPGAEELEAIRGTLREAQRAAPGGAPGAPGPGTGTLGEVRCDMGRYSRVFK